MGLSLTLDWKQDKTLSPEREGNYHSFPFSVDGASVLAYLLNHKHELCNWAGGGQAAVWPK